MSHPLAKLLTGGINNDECYNGDIRYIYEAAAALTAAAERETVLCEEVALLNRALDSRMRSSIEMLEGRAKAEAEVERLKLDRDSWERCALNTEVTVQAERQKVTALREELTNIAKANWREWDVDVRTPEAFVEWAVSRAQHALGLSPDAPQPPQETNCAECDGSGLVPSTWVDDEQPNRTCPVCDGSGTTDADSVPQPPGTTRETP